MTKPSILLLHASGTNRDDEAARACELAGGAPEIVHINRLRAGERHITDYDMLLIPGGFSYGDALGAGSRMALDLQVYLAEQLHDFVDRGKPVLGICNGFQVLVKAGLFGIQETGDGMRNTEHEIRNTKYGQRPITLTENENGRFECRWVHLAVNGSAKADFLANIKEPIFCPVAHGEGNFQVQNEATLARLDEQNLIAFRYVDTAGQPASGQYPHNPNGSAGDIAGICNARGNVVGLMPHPEDHIVPIQNPLGVRNGRNLGLQLFSAMIQAVQ